MRNIEGKNEEQLEAIEDQGKKQSLKTMSFFSGLSPEAKKVLHELKKEKILLVLKNVFV